jgi:hypothetical protein
MTVNQLIPAAQYLRMSTEHQQYSLENQAMAIQKYAESHNLEVVHTYSDTAKSGLVLRRRTGLQQLLQDVVSGASTYRAILVYDVSRWGRFQDTDESAHYEFLCKSAGAPVHYCAETVENWVKRYSRVRSAWHNSGSNQGVFRATDYAGCLSRLLVFQSRSWRLANEKASLLTA